MVLARSRLASSVGDNIEHADSKMTLMRAMGGFTI
jgi:hypothetical protein